MSSKHSDASRLRWSKLDKEQRALRMSNVARARWEKATKADKQAQAKKMVEGQKRKK